MFENNLKSLYEHIYICKWLKFQSLMGLTANTLSAYSHALLDYTTFCQAHQINHVFATREHIAAYIHNLATRPVTTKLGSLQIGYSNATMRQRIVAIRLYYIYLQEESIIESSPVRTGTYTLRRGFGGYRKGMLPHYRKLPWIPNDDQWKSILLTMSNEPIRNRFMLALAYDAALRREELCSLETGDINPTKRLITLRAETTKTKKSRIVPYSATTNELYIKYLQQRRKLSRERGPLFLSESRRNLGQPLTIWTWSKVIEGIAKRSGVSDFTTHTLRHLCLTDLARANWELHEIATFAGHKSLETTMIYIHLSGRELSEKLAKGMESIHAWRVQAMK